MRIRKSSIGIVGIAIAGLMFAGCNKNTANNADRKIAQKQLEGFQKNQPVPIFDWSQLRQNLIEVETSQARTTQTTSFFFNQGVVDPVHSCPSIGFPIPATYQLTNPQAKVVNHDLTLPQIEANGVYTDVTTGTYVICIDAQGKGYAFYWEGFVGTAAGPAKWDTVTHSMQLVGPPSFDYSTSRKK